MNLSNWNIQHVLIFIVFLTVLVAAEILVIQGLEVPQEFLAVITTLGAALAGLVTNPKIGE